MAPHAAKAAKPAPAPLAIASGASAAAGPARYEKAGSACRSSAPPQAIVEPVSGVARYGYSKFNRSKPALRIFSRFAAILSGSTAVTNWANA